MTWLRDDVGMDVDSGKNTTAVRRILSPGTGTVNPRLFVPPPGNNSVHVQVLIGLVNFAGGVPRPDDHAVSGVRREGHRGRHARAAGAGFRNTVDVDPHR